MSNYYLYYACRSKSLIFIYFWGVALANSTLGQSIFSNYFLLMNPILQLLRKCRPSSMETVFHSVTLVKSENPKLTTHPLGRSVLQRLQCSCTVRTSTPPSTSPATCYGGWQQGCWCNPLNLTRNTAGGGGDVDTGPGFKARTRISHSCLGHPARRPAPVGRRD